MSKRKTFYKICEETGELLKKRRTICPPGWFEDKKELLTSAVSEQLNKQFANSEEIIISSSPTTTSNENLQNRLKELEKENTQLKLQNDTLSKQLVSFEKQKRKDLAIQRQDLVELDRTALMIRKIGLREEEYFDLKNRLEGIHLRFEQTNEHVNTLQNSLEEARTRNRLLATKLETMRELIEKTKSLLDSIPQLEIIILSIIASLSSHCDPNFIKTEKESVLRQIKQAREMSEKIKKNIKKI